MTQILQPPDLKAIIQPILDRLTILERQPARALEIKDATGLTRVRAGIAPQINSLAAFDSLGNPLFDTSGLQQVMTSIGGITLSGTQPAQPFTTVMSNHPLTNGSFVLSRAVAVLLLATVNFVTNGGTASYGYIRLAVFNSLGGLVATSLPCIHTNGSGVSCASPYLLIPSLPPDTYTGWLQYSMDAGATTTWQMSSGQWNAFQLGG